MKILALLISVLFLSPAIASEDDDPIPEIYETCMKLHKQGVAPQNVLVVIGLQGVLKNNTSVKFESDSSRRKLLELIQLRFNLLYNDDRGIDRGIGFAKKVNKKLLSLEVHYRQARIIFQTKPKFWFAAGVVYNLNSEEKLNILMAHLESADFNISKIVIGSSVPAVTGGLEHLASTPE
ncbi:MAG: hypothetical protein ACPGXY_00085 [Alphaproteobacteria bacterium]